MVYIDVMLEIDHAHMHRSSYIMYKIWNSIDVKNVGATPLQQIEDESIFGRSKSRFLACAPARWISTGVPQLV